MIAYAGRQYDRAARVTCLPGGDSVLRVPVVIDPLAGAPSATRGVGLRIAYTVRKTLSAEPHRATVTIENLGPAARAALSSMAQRADLVRGVGAQLDARVFPSSTAIVEGGYVGAGGPSVLLRGALTSAESRHTRTTWTTTIEVGDHEVELASAECRRSFRAGTPALAILQYALGCLGVALAPLEVPPALVAYTLGRSFAAIGRARDVVDGLLAGVSGVGAAQGLPFDALVGPLALTRPIAWWIDDGAAYLMPRTGALPSAPIVVSPSGDLGVRLIEAPERVSAGHVRVRCLLTPSLRLGRRVLVRSTTLAGLYRVEEIEHTGDSWGGGDCTTTATLGVFGQG